MGKYGTDFFRDGKIPGRSYHWSPMGTEKSQPEGKQIMPETRFTQFLAFSIDPRVQSAWETDV